MQGGQHVLAAAGRRRCRSSDRIVSGRRCIRRVCKAVSAMGAAQPATAPAGAAHWLTRCTAMPSSSSSGRRQGMRVGTWRTWNGSTGSTTAGCTRPAATFHRSSTSSSTTVRSPPSRPLTWQDRASPGPEAFGLATLLTWLPHSSDALVAPSRRRQAPGDATDLLRAVEVSHGDLVRVPALAFGDVHEQP